MLVEGLETVRRNHEGHFDILEGLQEDGSSYTANQPVEALFVDHI
jgi:hypothetical protein